ncbi:bifunctional sugar phosphate isomerase/epimerase/4-hydroxyphenylpyruvate dioxygenase family protein [Methylobacterium sp. J-068]|uniref:bifunctional sugar phosphate isomerase/epimerase/4-hydroxyphenylpyruvate dioxygenase family protein n=1 Tax=Methylobacterium sp. J-068 TaxID=2836649 RepID=UPI001FB8FADD|nr:sugar phosphate isomerase/epimerase and 4-hydroxyphenylpyruvate domain-containing protein [Methylobacterium sp. J-068]MCJ2032990.1 sugar phosphate isomerase/epimerase and 4-hydroxyphenylpyruvate domain-containing protein [Methylobacterium sp. J-068]
MYNSIATVSLSGSLPEKLAAIAAAGFEGVELFEADVLADTHKPREIGRMIADHGLRCVTLQPFRDFEGLPEPRRAAVFDRAERKFDLAQELGTDLLMVCSSTVADASGDHARIAADLHELGARARRRDLRVAYEALAWGRHVNDHRDAWAIVRAADHPNAGLVLDSFHSLARGIPTESLLDIDPRRIFLVQMADAPTIQMDVLQWSRHLRCMPGQGGLALVEYVAALMHIGYDDVLSLEIFNDNFRANATRMTALDGVRSLTALRDEAARAGNAAAATLPPRIGVERLDFIEFAASRDDAVKLGALFEKLGFAPGGRHRSKQVSLWRQGRINFVLNSEPDGFAAAHGTVHGASVCAIGLAVNDVAAAHARAEGLRIPSFEQAHGPGERTLPAVRGVGGSLIEFVEAGIDPEAAWMQDFEIDPAADTRGAGLKAIDHFTQTVAHVELLSWRLFYTSLFAVQAEPQVDLVDPVGLVQSEVLHTANGAMTLALNSSASSKTLSSRFVDYYFGAGVQHVALATDSIFATAEALAARGIEFLAMPDNYYDDLVARFGLDASLVARMRRHQIIYDRDATGSYFHFFTRAFERRFFFEIVERRGYAGFDPQGAGIRLAAQTRLKLLPSDAAVPMRAQA